jgi:hypothetical protein
MLVAACWHDCRFFGRHFLGPLRIGFFMLSVSEVVARLLGSERVSALAERVAGRSRMGVWQRVLHQISTLGPIEARGYLRARGIAVVRDETRRLIEQEGAVAPAQRVEIEERAMEQLIEMVMGQVGQGRGQVTRRRAA